MDHQLDIKVIDLGRLIQFSLPRIKEHSFADLYFRFLKKPYRSNKNLMAETLQLGEILLKQIIYLFSSVDSTLNAYLVDLVGEVKGIPSLNALYRVVLEAKGSPWLADDLLAQPNEPHEGFNANSIYRGSD